MFAYGHYQAHQAPTAISLHPLLPQDLHILYQAQECLGWKQLYYGCLMPLWIAQLGYYHSHLNGNNYYAKIIRLIWMAIICIWKI